MRFTFLALLLSSRISVACPTPHADPDPHLRVRVYDFVGLSSTEIDWAEAESSRLLRPSVPVTWMNCRVAGDQPCGQEFRAGDLAVRVLPHTSAMIERHIVGVATVANQGVYAAILYDRVRALRSYGQPSGLALGRVMAHEITHLLLSADSHAPMGVMRPRWGVRDLQIDSASLWFYTAKQQAAMHAQLACRASAAADPGKSK